MVRFSHILALAIFSPAISVATVLTPVSREFTSEDLVGNFTRELPIGSTTICPASILQADFRTPEDVVGFLIPHADIQHDGQACEGPGETEINFSSRLQDRPESQAVLDRIISSDLFQDLNINIEEASLSNILAQASLVGLDRSPRTCGSAIGFPANTVYLYFNVDAPVVIAQGYSLLPGIRYIISANLETPDSENVQTCIYTAPIRSVSEVDATPLSDNGADAMPSPEETSGEASCFPADSLVTLSDGSTAQISSLEIGDRVLIGGNKFSEVFAFTHRDSTVRAEFVRLVVAVASRGNALLTETYLTIDLTPGHYLYLNGMLSAAKIAQVGDAVQLGDGSIGVVGSVQRVFKQGLYNPQTLHGDIVVNGVQTSTYTTAVEPVFAHAILAPLRALYTVFGSSPVLLTHGSKVIAARMPSGLSTTG